MGRKVTVTSIEGNSQRLDGGAMFGNAPRALWERWAEPDELGRINLACRCALVEIDDVKILLETGVGCYMPPQLAERFGVFEKEHVLLQNLAEHNVKPEDIDYVILSHLHFDHAGGLLSAYSGASDDAMKLVFPRATFVVGTEAWQRALNPHFRDRASFIPEFPGLLQDSDSLVVLTEDQGLSELPELSFFVSNGHTPGQLHTVIAGEKTNLVYCGDLIPGAPWVNLPITMGYDRYPELLIDEKQRLYDRIDASWRLFFTHDWHYAMAGVEQNAKGKFIATDLVESLDRVVL